MTVMSLSTFKNLTSKTFSIRNGAIGKIDNALKAYHTPPTTQDKLKLLKAAVDTFKDEKDSKYGDFSKSAREKKGGIALLSQQVEAALKPAPLVTVSGLSTGRGNLRQVRQGPVGGSSSGTTFTVGAQNTRMEGWAYAAFDPSVWTWTSEVATGHQGTLSVSQTSRITEAIRRTKAAIGHAHRAMISIGQLSAFPTTRTTEQGFYVDAFGAYDATRIAKVKHNFTVLKLAVERGPRIVDLRDTDYGLGCYAACFRGSLGRTEGRTGQVSVISALTVFLGRAFFASGSMNYGESTDATVGTLVHEFAHGAVDAVDVPPVDALGAWTHARKSDDPADRDFGDSTDNSIQASTTATVKLLAQHKPNYAIVNADSYGQFAAALLRHYGA